MFQFSKAPALHAESLLFDKTKTMKFGFMEMFIFQFSINFDIGNMFVHFSPNELQKLGLNIQAYICECEALLSSI